MKFKNGFGLTTAVLLPFFNDLLEDTLETIKWAKDNGFSWVEVRDKNVEFSKSDVEKIRTLANKLGIRIHYAWDSNDMLKPGNDALFKKAVQNAAVFGYDTIARLTFANSVFLENPKACGFTERQADLICEKVISYNRLAKASGVIPCYENALESLYNKGDEMGIEYFLNRLGFMKMTYDMGNALNKNAGACYASPKETEDFYEKYKNKAPYIHFKTTIDGIMQPKMVMDADVNFEKYFRMIPDDAWLCIEIPASETEAQTKENIIDALVSMKSFNM